VSPDNAQGVHWIGRCLRYFLFIACFQVVNILESRARSIELSKHRYYELLYAFHIKRNNYRKGWDDFGAVIVTRFSAKEDKGEARSCCILCDRMWNLDFVFEETTEVVPSPEMLWT